MNKKYLLGFGLFAAVSIGTFLGLRLIDGTKTGEVTAKAESKKSAFPLIPVGTGKTPKTILLINDNALIGQLRPIVLAPAPIGAVFTIKDGVKVSYEPANNANARKAVEKELFIQADDYFYAITSYNNKEEYHAAAGFVDVAILKKDGEKIAKIAEYKDVMSGWGAWGMPPVLSQVNDITDGPAIFAETAYGTNGEDVGSTHIVELTPDGPIIRGDISTYCHIDSTLAYAEGDPRKYDDEQSLEMNAKILPKERGKSIIVQAVENGKPAKNFVFELIDGKFLPQGTAKGAKPEEINIPYGCAPS